MKKFIANNWKKILIVIGVILIIINVGLKLMQEPNVVTGYIENGPIIEKDMFDKIGDTAEDATGNVKDNPDDIKDEYGEKTGIDTKFFRIMIITGVIVGGIILFSSLFESDDKKDAKKK
ncbi:MAG: hypothetical protein J6B87_00395 [Clostridia bacterium]|nr:hypothetical protein [Clostridia bacterium]